MKNQKNSKNNYEKRKNNMAKVALVISLCLFIILFSWFFIVKDKSGGLEKVAAQNYYDYKNNNSEFNLLIEGEISPYAFIYYFDQFKATGNPEYLKEIIKNDYIFYSDMARVLMADKMINSGNFREAKEILDDIEDSNLLSMKYYFMGVVYENENNFKKARNYYELIIKLKDSDSFLKELANLRLGLRK